MSTEPQQITQSWQAIAVAVENMLNSYKLRLFSFVSAVCLMASSLSATECQQITPSAYAKQRELWQGRTLVASASWCSSCKSKLLEAQKRPEDFVILVAFDEGPAMAAVLRKFAITSPCIVGEELVKELKIDGLPWHTKI